MSQDQIPEDKLVLYRQLVELCPNIDLKGAKKLTYTSVNGHMYSMMTKDGRFGMRLSKDDQKAFIEKYETTGFKNYGAKIKDYVEVPDDMLQSPKSLVPYLLESLAYTQTLKPK